MMGMKCHFYFVVVVHEDIRPDAPLPAERNPKMSDKIEQKRPMLYEAFIRTQHIVYSIFGNAWRMPKSVRDNYRAIEPVNDPRKAARIPQDGDK